MNWRKGKEEKDTRFNTEGKKNNTKINKEKDKHWYREDKKENKDREATRNNTSLH